MGGIIYGPYTGTVLDSTSETDIEHIVARSEAHDSGLCEVDAATKRRFASDLINLTLASPSVNRSQKSGKDDPPQNVTVLPVGSADEISCLFPAPAGMVEDVWPPVQLTYLSAYLEQVGCATVLIEDHYVDRD